MESPASAIPTEDVNQANQEEKYSVKVSPPEGPWRRFRVRKIATFAALFLSFLLAGLLGFLFPYLRMKSLESVNLELEARAQRLKGLAEGSEGQVQRLQDQAKMLQARVKSLEEQSSSLRSKTKQYEKEVARMREQVEGYVLDRENSKEELDQSYAKISELWKNIKAMEELLGKTLTPQVMRVNRSFNYVVVNIGLRDQIKMGDTLTIERLGRRVGSVQIEKLYDDFAAAAILEESADSSIQEGDIVRRN
jgi:predicted RNase H-like nuclease (RuvC/YqgF family)